MVRDRFPHPYTIEDAKKFLAKATAKNEREEFYCIDIEGSAVGSIGVHPGEDVHRLTAEFGYWLAEEFWGQGIMSEVVPAFVKYCFEKFALTRMFATAHENNAASVRVLEKAGFASLRQNELESAHALPGD
jgi:RimJ/RimL family protein N-acetyltransferase